MIRRTTALHILRPYHGERNPAGSREALLSAATEVEKQLAKAPCDSEAVADCLRCKSFFLAVKVKQMIELLDAEEGR